MKHVFKVYAIHISAAVLIKMHSKLLENPLDRVVVTQYLIRFRQEQNTLSQNQMHKKHPACPFIKPFYEAGLGFHSEWREL